LAVSELLVCKILIYLLAEELNNVAVVLISIDGFMEITGAVILIVSNSYCSGNSVLPELKNFTYGNYSCGRI
jgi:hypothetical protein